MSLLSDSESSGDEKKVVERLKINEKFADRFERSERVKDLHRAKELLKNADADEDEESDSESETEDEDAEQLSLGLDLKIIQTINSLRKKDPKIYDPNAKWFDEPEESSSDDEGETKAKGDTKKKKYKDILREQLLESEAAGGLGDGDGIETSARGVRDTASRNTLVYDAEQEKIRQAFLKSAGKAADESSDSDEQDGVLRLKRKSAQETKAEELELQRALQEMKELAAKNAKAEESKKKSKDKNKTVLLESDVEEGFLENYLEKQLWKDKESTQRRRRDAAEASEEENLEEDEAELDQVDRFESKYNFRFEEMQDEKNRMGEAGSGGMVEVMGHARDVQGSMRRADEKRKTQRESRKERKEKERRQQEAELRRLKNLKRQELRERLQQIGKMSGLGDLGLDDEDDEFATEGDAEGEAEEEAAATKKKSRKGGKRARNNKLKLNEDFLDEDWDPEKHEALMAAQFGDDYYGEEDENFNVADLDDPEAYERYLGDDGLGDVDYGEGDGDYDDASAGAAEGGDKHAARAELRKTAAAMEDELYQLDYEDIVAGLPCRFKYKQVEKEGFGLTAEDILLADDAELNKYVSLKKISAYNHHSGVQEAELSKKRKRLRENVKERLAKQAEEAEKAGQQLKGTKPKAKAAAEDAEDDEDEMNVGAGGGEDEGKRRKRKRRKGANAGAEPVELISKKTVAPAPSAPVAAPVAAAAQEGSSSKDEKKKKAKKASRKKEETVQEKRMNLYK